jgi:hypothetical protein
MIVKTVIEVCHELNAEEIEKFNALTKAKRWAINEHLQNQNRREIFS